MSGAVTNDGDFEEGGDEGDVVGQLKLAVVVGAGHLASDTVTNDGDVEEGGEDDDHKHTNDEEEGILAGTASGDLLTGAV